MSHHGILERRILYYPFYEPDPAWLRSMLLFYDTIHTIVPPHVGFTPSEHTRKLMDAAKKELFEPLPPPSGSLTLDEEDLRVFRSGCDLATEGFRRPPLAGRAQPIQVNPHAADGVQVRTPVADGVEVDSFVFVHERKMPRGVFELLKDKELIKRSMDAEAQVCGYYEVQQEAADLLLALIAKYVARGEKDVVPTVTDRIEPYMVASTAGLVQDKRVAAKHFLASYILKTVIPDEIEKLPVHDYIELRKRYQKAKGLFHNTMGDLEDSFGLSTIADAGTVEAKVRAIANDFGQAVNGIVESRAAEGIKKWAPIALGLLSALVAPVAPWIACGTGVAGISLGIFSGISSDPIPTDYRPKETRHMLAQVRRDIEIHYRMGSFLYDTGRLPMPACM